MKRNTKLLNKIVKQYYTPKSSLPFCYYAKSPQQKCHYILLLSVYSQRPKHNITEWLHSKHNQNKLIKIQDKYLDYFTNHCPKILGLDCNITLW